MVVTCYKLKFYYRWHRGLRFRCHNAVWTMQGISLPAQGLNFVFQYNKTGINPRSHSPKKPPQHNPNCLADYRRVAGLSHHFLRYLSFPVCYSDRIQIGYREDTDRIQIGYR